MRVTVQTWPQGGYIIMPDRQPPFPIIFATYAQALAYAATLATTPDTSASSTVEVPHAPPTATPMEKLGVDTRGPWVIDNPVISTPAWPVDVDADADVAERHASRGVPRGTGTAEHARRAGLTPAQYHLLLAVRAHPAYPAVTIAALAERLHIRHQSASRRVAHAVAHGLLHRHPAATDRRLVLVSLTDTGAQTLDRVTRAIYVETAMLQPPR